MLTVDATVTEALARRHRTARYVVSYKLRYWDVDAQAYAYQASWTTLPDDEVQSVTASQEDLDLDSLTEFRAANITLRIANDKNVWSGYNPNGKLKPDSTTRLGYILHRSLFKVEMLYRKADGSDATAVPIFEGYVSDPARFFPDERIAELTLEDKRLLLRLANAENVSTAVADELLGTGDGVTTDFTTANVGVGRIHWVTVNGYKQRGGIDYDAEDLSDKDNPATVSLTNAASKGEEVRASYLYWKQDEYIEDLVEDLCVEAGLSAAEYTITDVSYRNYVINRGRRDSQAEWQAGTNTHVDTTTVAGSIVIADDFPTKPASISWTVDETITNGVWADYLNGKSLQWGVGIQTGWSSAHAAQTIAYGTWENILWINASSVVGSYAAMDWWFIADGADRTTASGYAIRSYCVNNAGSFESHLLLLRFDAGVATTLWESTDIVSDLSPKAFTIRITRDADNKFSIWASASSSTRWYAAPAYIYAVVATDDTYATSTNQLIAILGVNVQASATNYCGALRYASPIATGWGVYWPTTAVHLTSTFDGTADFYRWVDVVPSQTLPAGTAVAYATQVSDDDITYDSPVAISGTVIMSEAKRYGQVQLTLTPDTSQSATPQVDAVQVRWLTTTTTITLANFTGWTCLDAVNELAKLSGYEWGITREGVLFFRPRPTSTTPDLSIANVNVRGVLAWSDGIDRVYNRVTASYGNYEVVTDVLTRNDPSPNSQDMYGVRELNVGASQLLLSPDADVATGMALAYLDRFKHPRRFFEVETQHLPTIELGDVVQLLFEDASPVQRWHIGDHAAYIGRTDIGLWGAEQQSAYDIIGRVVGVSHDPHGELSRLSVEEIL